MDERDRRLVVLERSLRRALGVGDPPPVWRPRRGRATARSGDGARAPGKVDDAQPVERRRDEPARSRRPRRRKTSGRQPPWLTAGGRDDVEPRPVLTLAPVERDPAAVWR